MAAKRERFFFFLKSVMCEISAWSVTAAEAGQEVQRDEEFQLQYFLLALVNISHLFGQGGWKKESACKVNKKSFWICN